MSLTLRRGFLNAGDKSSRPPGAAPRQHPLRSKHADYIKDTLQDAMAASNAPPHPLPGRSIDIISPCGRQRRPVLPSFGPLRLARWVQHTQRHQGRRPHRTTKLHRLPPPRSSAAAVPPPLPISLDLSRNPSAIPFGLADSPADSAHVLLLGVREMQRERAP
ncbi:hypothetical protein V8E36_002606 [Tilletia maclaganii]